jgi:hypothetical protein
MQSYNWRNEDCGKADGRVSILILNQLEVRTNGADLSVCNA